MRHTPEYYRDRPNLCRVVKELSKAQDPHAAASRLIALLAADREIAEAIRAAGKEATA